MSILLTPEDSDRIARNPAVSRLYAHLFKAMYLQVDTLMICTK